MRTCVTVAVVAMLALPVAAEFVPWTADFDSYEAGPIGNVGDGWRVLNNGDLIQVVDNAPGDRGKAFLFTTAGSAYDATPRLGNSNIFCVDPDTGYPYSQVISFDTYFVQTPTNLASEYDRVDTFQVVIGQWVITASWSNALVAHGWAVGGTNVKSGFEFRSRDQANQSYQPFQAQEWYHVELAYDLENYVGWMTVQDESGTVWTSDVVALEVAGQYSDVEFRFSGEGGAQIRDAGGGLIETLPIDFYLNNVSVQALVPEPATMTLLGLGAVALLRRRR